MYLFLAKGVLVRHFGIPLCSIDTGYLFAIHNSFKSTIYSLEGGTRARGICEPMAHLDLCSFCIWKVI